MMCGQTAGNTLYRRYLLGVLIALLLSNYIDRIAFALVLPQIKSDLALTDTQLGLLTGMLFALFYSTLGIPIARFADHGDRIIIIAGTAALWSFAVAATGLANDFIKLAFVRMVVAIGEAGCIPPALSLIADYYDKRERVRATSLYYVGGALSLVVGFYASGVLDASFGWRGMFAIIAIPGLVLSVIAWFTLHEPRSKGGARASIQISIEAPRKLKEDLVYLAGNRTFVSLVLCLSSIYLFGYGMLQWQPSFFVRSYGLTSKTVGTLLAVTYGISAFLGTITGGEVTSRFAGGNESLQLKLIALATTASTIATGAAYLVHDLHWSLWLIAMNTFANYLVYGPLMATVQSIIRSRLRALAVASAYLVANLIGMGLGPLLTGVLSDQLKDMVGLESLRYALFCLSPGYLLAAWFAMRASTTVVADAITSPGEA